MPKNPKNNNKKDVKDVDKNDNDFESEDARVREGDHCQRKCFILCASPAPFRVAIFPFFVALIILVTMFVLFFWDYPGYCEADQTRPRHPPTPCFPTYLNDPAYNESRLISCYVQPYNCNVYDQFYRTVNATTCNYACEPTYVFIQPTNQTILTCPLPCVATSYFDVVANATVYTTCPANPFPCSVYDPEMGVHRLTACPVNDITRYYPCVPNKRWDPFVGRMVTTTCPTDDHMCAYITVANVPVAVWSLFFIVLIVGWAVISLIITVIWAIFRLISGKYGMMWEYLKPIAFPWFLLSWDFLFFICYNRFLYYAVPLVLEVCRAIAVVILILCVTYIVASLISTLVSRSLASTARARALKFRYKARLVDLVIKNDAISMDKAYTQTLDNLDAKIAVHKNERKRSDKVHAAKAGKASESIEMKKVEPEVYTTSSLSEKDLANSFNAIDTNKNSKISRDELTKYAGVKEFLAADLWALFSPEDDGEIFLPEFITGIRDLERSLKDTINELEDRRYMASLAYFSIMSLFLVIGVTIALESIGLHISVLVAAVALLAIALALLVSGLLGRYISSLTFLLYSHPYYKGDSISVLGGAPILVTKITLLNTYGYSSEGKWVMFDNATLSASSLENLSRSKECVFTFETSVHAETPKGTLNDWENSIRNYITKNPKDWRDFTFVISSVSKDNKLNIEMKAYARGSKWSNPATFNNKRADLWLIIHNSATQLGVYFKPTGQNNNNNGSFVPMIQDVQSQDKDETEVDYIDNKAEIVLAKEKRDRKDAAKESKKASKKD